MQFMTGAAPKQWLADETIFSFCSRYHQLSDHHISSQTTLRLFGHPRTGSAHDFPARIDWLATRMDGRLGDPDFIVRSRTILPYYLPLRSAEVAAEAVSRLRGDGIGSLKFQLGLLTSRFRAHHPLKACARCIADDRRRYGVAIWHLPHQLPGTWLCAKHDEPLRSCIAKTADVERFLWHLPNPSSLTATDPPSTTISQLRDMASVDMGLWSMPVGQHFEPQYLLETYLDALRERNFAMESGRLKLAPLSAAFAAHSAGLRAIPAFSGLPANVSEAQVQLGRLFRLPRTGTHPLRHLAVITWLFPSWESFRSAYLTAASRQPAPNEGAASELNHGSQQDEVSRRIGKPQRPAPSPKVRTAPRPKRLHAPVRRIIVAALQGGVDCKQVAADTGFSIPTIGRVLRGEPGLQEQWRAAALERLRAQQREKWLAHRASNPTCSIKELRLGYPAAYAWLYRNDQVWLRSTGSPPPAERSGNHVSISWDERDRELSQAIRRVALDRAERTPGGRVTKRALLEAIPELAVRMRQLSRLPLSSRALDSALSTHARKPRSDDDLFPC